MELPDRNQEVYAHAPISEAILELRVQPVKQAAIKNVSRRLLTDLPVARPFKESTATFGEDQHSITSKLIGWDHLTVDERLICRVTEGAFAFIQRSPYKDWWYFHKHAFEKWSIYRSEVDTPITRIGLRYVNLIKIETDTLLSDYFRIGVQYPTVLGEKVESILSKIRFPILGADYHVDVTQFLPKFSRGETPVMTLDLDVSVEGTFTDDEAWERVEYMRKLKNFFFEESVTDKLRERFR